MSFEPGLYTITKVDSSASVCLGPDTLLGETPLVVPIADDFQVPNSIPIEFEIAEPESDGRYTLTINGGNGKVIVSQGQAVVSELPSAVPEVWRFVPGGPDPNEPSYSIELATEDQLVGWYYEDVQTDPEKGTTNILVGPLPCCIWFWKVHKVG